VATNSEWQVPTELPDLRRVGIVSLDTETKDDGLRADRGPAWPWRGGHVCGISVAYHADGGIRSHYFPLRHPDTDNFYPARVFDWLKDLIASDVRFVTQNGLYDWGWLRTDGDILMPPADRLEEIGALATLVDENRFAYGLDALCAWRGLPGKDTTLLQQAIKTAGFAPKRKKINAQAHIWQLPARYVGAYAEADAANTLALWEDLDPVLDREKTRDAYRLEIDLLPMVHEMRRRGIRIDQTAAEQARDLILRKRDGVLAELSEKLDAPITMGEIGSPRWKAQTFDKHGIAYPRTAKGNPSFRGGKTGWMVAHPHWLPQLIARATKYDGTATRFLEGHILDHIINARVHSEIHPHRSDDGSGACSLRFSYSDPPLQQMPSRDKELAPLVRGVFLPEQGEVWAKPDISQQEFRFVVHYAVLRNLPRAKEAADLYRTDPDADFHAMVADMTGLERESAKAANFAKIFGAGPEKFAEMIGKPLREARAIYHQYDRKLPFISRLSDMCQREAKRLGHTELYDGAHRHWDRWEAPGIYAKGAGPCSREEAQRRTKDTEHPWFGRWLRRVKTHTAMNALIQGSAARHTKLWMRACWREGIVPLLQMHDALECSVATREQGELVARLGCEAVHLEVPMRVDLKFGRSWSDAKHTWEELTGAALTPKRESVAAPEPQRTPPGINGAKVHLAVAQAPIELPQDPAEGTTMPSLADLIDEPLVNDKVCCPFHDDSTPSCHIYSDHFHCFGCGAHGDAIDWLMMVEGLDRDAAIELLANWQGLSSQPRTNEDNAHTFANAMRLWEQAQPIAGTPAIQYLADVRKIDTGALPAGIGAALRFHRRCPFGPGTRYPCLLALMRDGLADAPIGIQRIALTPEVLAGGKVERRMLGRAGTVKLWPAASSLVIGEGIETVLAAATRIPYRGAPLQPAWSTLTSGKLSTFPVLPGVERLIILVDHDINGAGQLAATVCTERWSRAGRTVVRLTPERAGADFNDLVMPE
jgi:DNA polymerase I-like protein with 3'-5' exonuclease and polymerase domains